VQVKCSVRTGKASTLGYESGAKLPSPTRAQLPLSLHTPHAYHEELADVMPSFPSDKYHDAREKG
jgi:hypothetical protein